MAHVLGNRGMHINNFVSDIDKSKLSRCKDPQYYKATKKGLVNEYLHKTIYSIYCLNENS